MTVVTRSKDRQFFVIKDDGSHLQEIRQLPGRVWNHHVKGAWTAPYCSEVWEHLVRAGFVTASNRPADLKSGYQAFRPYGQTYLVIRTLGTPQDIRRCQRIPEMRSYSRQEGAWVCKPTQANIAYLRKNFPQLVWEGTAEHLADALMERNIAPNPEVKVKAQAKRHQLEQALDDPINDYRFHTKGYAHQVKAFKLSRHQEAFALLMEQGTGKAWITVNTAAYQFEQGNITGLLVLCPNGMKEPWEEELQKHLPPGYALDVFTWNAHTRHKAEQWVLASPPGERKLRVLIMNIDAMSGLGSNIARLFLSKHTSLAVVDESSRIKSSSAARTKTVIKLAKLSKYRRIMSGTPVTQGPLDIFTQLKFLDPAVLGYSSFYAFRNRYALLGGWQGKQVVGYQYLDELQAKIDTISFRVLKEECLDLPDKVYEKRVVELTPEQRAIYDGLDADMKAAIDLDTGEVAQSLIMHVITKVMRMQQVVGGFFTADASEDLDQAAAKAIPIPGGNPKLTALLEILEETPEDQKVIIWARFRPELAAIAAALRGAYGEASVVEFHGGVDDLTRQQGRRDFQASTSGARFFVGQPQAGGIGLTLTAASLMVYFSNDYNLETRLQSEDRFHRIGQEAKKVTIIDIVAKATWDAKIVGALRAKKKIADLVLGDRHKAWV